MAYGTKPVWSRDGSIAFTVNRWTSGLVAVWLLDQRGGVRLLIPDAYDAAWSSDGARLAFVSTRSR